MEVIVCDQGSNNRKALEGLGVTEEAPYFMHGGRQIFVVYDPPHLLKNMRNNLKKTGFKINDMCIRWEYIKEFYNVDSRKSIRMAPKLTKKHVTLPPFASLRVKYAAQVLSHSVAAGMYTMVELKALPQEASETAPVSEVYNPSLFVGEQRLVLTLIDIQFINMLFCVVSHLLSVRVTWMDTF